MSLFLQKCLFPDTGVSFPTKMSLCRLRSLFSPKSVSFPTRMTLRWRRCLSTCRLRYLLKMFISFNSEAWPAYLIHVQNSAYIGCTCTCMCQS
jgi:hypothetical protein